MVDRRAHGALAQALGRRVHGRDPLEVDQVFLVGLVFDDLELRMIDDDLRAACLGLAVDDDALTRREDLLHVVRVEPADDQHGTQCVARGFLERHLEHLPAPAEPLGRRGNNDPAHADGAVPGHVGEVLELPAILVAARIVGQQIADGEQTQPFERLCPVRSQPGKVGHRLRQREEWLHHRGECISDFPLLLSDCW